MLASVIIPAFNREATIGRAIESVLAQTHAPLELIVVDDGSTDRTADVARGYGPQVSVIRQPNGGPGAARNAGIRAAVGAIVAFLDSDDAWHPDKLARQVALMTRTAPLGVSCCVCNATMLHADGRSRTSFEIAGLRPGLAEGLWLNPAAVLVTRFLLFNQVVAVWRDALDKVGPFASHLRLMEDHDLALRLAVAAPWAFIAEPLVTWHGGAANSLSHAARATEIVRYEHDILSRFRRSSLVGSELDQLVERRLRLLRWRMSGTELTSQPRRRHRLLGRLLLRALQTYEAYTRRRRSFPRMQVRPAALQASVSAF